MILLEECKTLFGRAFASEFELMRSAWCRHGELSAWFSDIAKQWEWETSMIVMTGSMWFGRWIILLCTIHQVQNWSLMWWLSDSAGCVKFHEVIANRPHKSWTQFSMIMIMWLRKYPEFFVKLAWRFSSVYQTTCALSKTFHVAQESLLGQLCRSFVCSTVESAMLYFVNGKSGHEQYLLN